jgi:hypothetical protein
VITIISFVVSPVPVRSTFAACAVKRYAALNTNCPAIHVVGAAFGTVNYALFLHPQPPVWRKQHKTFGSCFIFPKKSFFQKIKKEEEMFSFLW